MPSPQAESPNLRRADVNVVRAGEVVVFRAAQEAKPIRKDLQHTLTVHQSVTVDAFLEYFEDEVMKYDNQ